jgi:hypothetical protein
LQQEIEKRAAAEERVRIFESQRQQQPAQPAQPQQQVAPEVQQAKQQLASLIKEMAPELGFVSKQEIQQQEQMKAVDSEQVRLEGKYNGADGLPKYEKQAVLNYAIEMGMTSPKGLEIAYKQMHEAEIMNARVQRALAQSRGIQSETSNGTGSANTGVSESDLKKAAEAGDSNATHLILKRRLSGK